MCFAFIHDHVLISLNKGVTFTPLLLCSPFLYCKFLQRKFSLHFLTIYLLIPVNQFPSNCHLWKLHQWSLIRVESVKNFTNKSAHFIPKYTVIFSPLPCDFSWFTSLNLALKKLPPLIRIYFYLLFCDTIGGEMWRNVYSPQIGNWWQITEAMPPRSKLVN